MCMCLFLCSSCTAKSGSGPKLACGKVIPSRWLWAGSHSACLGKFGNSKRQCNISSAVGVRIEHSRQENEPLVINNINQSKNLFAVILVLNGVDSTAWSWSNSEVKLGIFAVAASIAQEWIFLIVVNCTSNKHMPNLWTALNETFSQYECSLQLNTVPSCISSCLIYCSNSTWPNDTAEWIKIRLTGNECACTQREHNAEFRAVFGWEPASVVIMNGRLKGFVQVECKDAMLCGCTQTAQFIASIINQ